MSVHVVRFACSLALLLTFLTARPSSAAEVQLEFDSVAYHRAQAGVGARTAFGIGMSAAGVAMVPIATESIISGQIQPMESGGYFVSAAILGFGGIPLIAQAGTRIGADPLDGARARVRLAKDGVTTYALLGGLLGALSLGAGAVVLADTGTLPGSLLAFNISTFSLVATAVGLAADGDLARLSLPVDQRATPRLKDLAAPMLATGIVMLTVATPITRLLLYKEGKSVDASFMPMIGGITYLTLGITSLVISEAMRRPPRRLSQTPRPQLGVLADPASGHYGLTLQGRF